MQAPHLLPEHERSRFWGLRFRIREHLRHSLVAIPALYIAAAVLLGELVPRVEGERDLLSLELDADTARTMLSAIAGGMIAFTGLVVSIAILVVQFGASQYTPRLVNRFRRDAGVKHSLGIFIAPAIFALISMRTIGENESSVVPSLSVVVSLVLLCAAVIAFFLLIGGLLDLLRPRRIVGRIVDNGIEAIDETYPSPFTESHTRPDITGLELTAEISHQGRPGVVSAIDRGALVRAATSAQAVVELVVPVGAYVPPGASLFRVYGTGASVDRRALCRAIVLDEERTITQDPAFALRAIVDIALRALSPAVNDPTTAVQAIDGIEALLLVLGRRDLQSRGAIADSDGRPRVIYPTPTWEQLLDLSLTEIIHFGIDSPQIPRRINAALNDLEAALPEQRHGSLAEQRAMLDSAVTTAYPSDHARAHAGVADRLGIGGQ